jgi:hypothetical protein
MDKYIDEEAKENLASHKWPGNIRELENVIQRLMIASSSDAITVIDVIKELDGSLMGGLEAIMPAESDQESDIDLTSIVEAFEKNIIREACEKYGSTRKAAKAIGISQTQPGQSAHKVCADPLTGENVCHILLIQRVIGMNDGRCRFLGNMPRKLIAEILTLTVDHIRLPVDQLTDIPVAIGYRHPHIRIDHSQRNGFDVIDISIFVAFQLFRNRQHTHLMSLFLQLLHQIADGGDHAVGGGDIEVRRDQHFHD